MQGVWTEVELQDGVCTGLHMRSLREREPGAGRVGGGRNHHSSWRPPPVQDPKEFKRAEFEMVLPGHSEGIFVKVGE